MLELLQLAACNLADVANLSLSQLHHCLLHAKLSLLHIEVTSSFGSIHHHCRLVLLQELLARGDVIRSGRSLSIQRVVRIHNLRKFEASQNIADRILQESCALDLLITLERLLLGLLRRVVFCHALH